MIKQEYQERHHLIDESGSQTIYLRRYKCNNCGKKFVTSPDSIIKPHHRYANIFADKIESFIQTGYRSLHKSEEDIQTFLGISPSHTTIKNWPTIEAENHIPNISTVY